MSWEPIWEKIHSEKEWGKYPSEPLVRFVGRNFLKKPRNFNLRFLELGCGTGANLWFLAREQVEIYGVEGSKTAVEKARTRLNKEVPGWRGQIIQGDILNLPFDDNFFDAVIDVEAVTHNGFEASQRIYQEAERVLKKGAMLYTQTFATGTWGDQTGLQIEKNGWIPTEGPTGLGEFVRFTPYEDLAHLLQCFEDFQVEKLSWTTNDQSNEFVEWIVTAKKCELDI